MNGASLLAIDADPNSCLAEALGIENPQTIVGTCEEISKDLGKIPSGMSKDRYIEMRVQESLTEHKDFDLLVMGRPEGPGCYCYVNNLLRDLIGRITKNYDFVIMDNAAGMEHISRRTAGTIAKLVLVSDYSITGIRSVKRIYDLAVELKIKVGGGYLIVNKVSGPISALDGEIKKTGLTVLGAVPYDEDLIKWNISNQSILDFKSTNISKTIGEIFERMLKGDYACRAS